MRRRTQKAVSEWTGPPFQAPARQSGIVTVTGMASLAVSAGAGRRRA
ncbi:hypothetical protein [Streptomyces sp. NPDC059010]